MRVSILNFLKKKVTLTAQTNYTTTYSAILNQTFYLYENVYWCHFMVDYTVINRKM